MATRFGVLAWRISWTEDLAEHGPWGRRVGMNGRAHTHRVLADHGGKYCFKH